jgi:DNA-directed RNA polymerase subunit L
VKFSGYKHPHPLDNDIVFRVQTSAGVLPSAAFIAGANHLEQEFRTLQERLRSEIARVKADVEDFDRDEQI